MWYDFPNVKQLVARVRAALANWFQPTPAPATPARDDKAAQIQILRTALTEALADKQVLEALTYQANLERAAELVEAQQMAGSGPWLSAAGRLELARDPGVKGAKLRELTSLRENIASPLSAQGAFGDIELALQNVEWRREINLSWMEFSRWGIQQIMLISRLYYIKNPIIRRLIDICAAYVFGRGVEVTSDDEDANATLADFFQANQKTLGQIALVQLERQKYYDGNLFFAFFSDTQETGTVQVRNFDATEIMDIVNDPDDADSPQYYKRSWIQRNFDTTNAQLSTVHKDAYYPALGFKPDNPPKEINGIPVIWESPILHRKCGHVAKWTFGCPIIYAALDWAKEARKYLEACATVKRALSQIAMTLTTKGGQQAIEGAKNQLATTVGPGAPIWDTNPTPVNASIFAAGPGTTLAAFSTKGAGGDPEEVRQYKLMCCVVVGVPETFLADVSTGNLATATTLDRPTELVFLEKQEAWSEDLVIIARYVLEVSKAAPKGQLREALERRKLKPGAVRITEMRRKQLPSGRYVYIAEAKAANGQPTSNTIQVRATFPAIREGDMAQIVTAIVQAMTLNNTQGQVVGIDEREGVLLLLQQLGVENAEDIVEKMYPAEAYGDKIDRTVEPEPAAPPAAAPAAPPEPPPAAVPGKRPVARAAPATESSLIAEAVALRDVAMRLLDGRANPHARP